MLRFQIKWLSMTDQSTIYQKPFWVVNAENFFVAAFDNKDDATDNAEKRNRSAEKMGKDYEYHVIDRPE